MGFSGLEAIVSEPVLLLGLMAFVLLLLNSRHSLCVPYYVFILAH